MGRGPSVDERAGAVDDEGSRHLASVPDRFAAASAADNRLREGAGRAQRRNLAPRRPGDGIGPVPDPLWIGQDWEWEVKFRPKRGGFRDGSLTNDEEVRSRLMNLIEVLSQVNDLSAAERSPKVADEDKNHPA